MRYMWCVAMLSALASDAVASAAFSNFLVAGRSVAMDSGPGASGPAFGPWSTTLAQGGSSLALQSLISGDTLDLRSSGRIYVPAFSEGTGWRYDINLQFDITEATYIDWEKGVSTTAIVGGGDFGLAGLPGGATLSPPLGVSLIQPGRYWLNMGTHIFDPFYEADAREHSFEAHFSLRIIPSPGSLALWACVGGAMAVGRQRRR